MFARIDHIGVAVEDLDAAIALYERDASGWRSRTARPSTSRGSRRCCSTSATRTSSCCGRSARHAGRQVPAKRGAGLHHVAYGVEDIEATLDALRERGMRLIDEQPRTGIRGTRVAFLHPSSSGGVLTEIVEAGGGH